MGCWVSNRSGWLFELLSELKIQLQPVQLLSQDTFSLENPHASSQRLFAHSATSLTQELTTLESTCEPIQEKSLFIANSVTTPAQCQVISRSTCSLIRGRSYFIAPNVPLPSLEGITSNGICQHIPGRSVSAVTSATIHPTKLVISRHTC